MARTSGVQANGQYRKTTLKNGLRVVTERLPSVRSISIGLWADIGSRHEKPEENGLSHFVEHMVFKGTHKRSAKQIASSLESLGGSLNGFTSREQTCYMARILDNHLEEAVDVLADLACNATLSAAHMNKERLVICEEIKESLDTPSDHIHDLFSRAFWGEHPLGRPIMGNQDIIMNMSRSRMKDYLRRNYRTGSILVSASGAVSHDRLVRMVRERLSFPEGEAEPAEKGCRTADNTVSIVPNDSCQTHFCLGFPGFSFQAEEKMAILALSAHLGGGMSSVLFQKIREEHGLAYSVYTYHDFYKDTGVFATYIGTDKAHVRQAYSVILKEIRRLRKRKLTSAKVDAAKEQLKGNLTLGLESTSARMNRLARLELLTGGYQPLPETLKEIDRVTPADVADVANKIFDESKMAAALLGPADKDVFDKVE